MKGIVLAGGLGLALAGLAEPAIKDGSVIGYWKFDGTTDAARKADSSGYGNTMNALASGASTSATGGTAGGCLTLTSGKTTTAPINTSGTPAFNATATYPYYTFATRFKSGGKIISSIFVDSEVKAVVNDTANWHFAAQRYHSNLTGSSYSYMAVLDPRWNDSLTWIKADGSTDTKRPLELASNESAFIISATQQAVTFGGSLSGNAWYGSLDEAMVVNRLLSKREMTRLNFTGETYVYCHSGNPNFAAATGWSSCEGSYVPVPGAMPGAPYIVDNGKTMTQNATATFGGTVDKKVSLTLGRLAALTYPEGTETKTVTTVGNFTQSANTAITFYDLRLNDGTITAGGTSLTTTLLDVEAPASKPFVLAAANDFALNVGAATTGAGVLAKTGAGKLTVNAWTGTAKLRLAEGSIKTPRFNGYAGGTVLVSVGSTVAFAGDDALPTTANKMKILFDGTKPTAKTAVMTVPAGVTAAMIQDATAYANGQVGIVTVEDGTVYVEPVYPEDLGSVPVLMVE